jgi:hypothetical protein
VNGVRIGTPDEAKRRHVVGRHHSRVRGVELIGPSVPCQLRRDLVNPLGDDEHGSVGGLGEEIPHRPVEAPRQYDALPVLGDEREGAVDREGAGRVGREETTPGVRFRSRPEALRFRRNEVDDAGNGTGLGHEREGTVAEARGPSYRAYRSALVHEGPEQLPASRVQRLRRG